MESTECTYKGIKKIDGNEYHAFNSSIEILVLERWDGAEMSAFLSKGDKITIKGDSDSSVGNQIILKNVKWDFCDE